MIFASGGRDFLISWGQLLFGIFKGENLNGRLKMIKASQQHGNSGWKESRKREKSAQDQETAL